MTAGGLPKQGIRASQVLARDRPSGTLGGVGVTVATMASAVLPRYAVAVCICTHNPRREVLATVLSALARQTASKDAYRVLVVDNASEPALTAEDLAPLGAAGVRWNLIREEALGIAKARLRAIRETTEPWVLFVDDDNEVATTYLDAGLQRIETDPTLGCFGGRLLLAAGLQPPLWMGPFLPYLGIKDEGPEPITGGADHWGPWEPPTAGAFVRRPLLELYANWFGQGDENLVLGRVGSQSLLSCEDSLMMRGAVRTGLNASYEPSLVLWHHLDPRRFRLGYLLRLFYGYGKSHVILERVLRATPRPPQYSGVGAVATMLHSGLSRLRENPRFALALVVYHLGAVMEWQKGNLNTSKKVPAAEP